MAWILFPYSDYGYAQHDDHTEHKCHHCRKRHKQREESSTYSVEEYLAKSVTRFSEEPLFSGVFMLLGKHAVRVLMDMPDTWTPYLKEKDYYGIYEMEMKELAEAIAAKPGSGLSADKELTHVAAAMMLCVMHDDTEE